MPFETKKNFNTLTFNTKSSQKDIFHLDLSNVWNLPETKK